MKKIKSLSKYSIPTVLLVVSNSSFADKNWSGFYVGGAINQTESKSNSTTSYSNNGANPPVGWSQNQFKGDVLNSINSMRITPTYPGFDHNTNTISLPTASSSFNSNKNITGGNIFAGINKQVDQIIFGAEINLSFGNFGSSNSQNLNGGGNNYISDGEGANFSYTNYNNVIQGLASPIADGRSNSADYTQQFSQQNSSKYNLLSQLLVRTGYSFGKVMTYVKGGVAYSNVTASTSAQITESVSGTNNAIGSSTSYSGSTNYSFAGNTSKNMYGYVIGGGAEWALQDNLLFRLDAQYYDLGKISVTGASNQTSATYSVSQKISAYSISVGIIHKF